MLVILQPDASMLAHDEHDDCDLGHDDAGDVVDDGGGDDDLPFWAHMLVILQPDACMLAHDEHDEHCHDGDDDVDC